MTAHRGDAFVLEKDFGLGAQGLLQLVGPHQGRRPPDLVNLLDLLGNLDEPLAAHLLFQQSHGKDGGQLFRGHGFLGFRIQGRLQPAGDIRGNIVPAGGHLIFSQDNLFHDFSFSS